MPTEMNEQPPKPAIDQPPPEPVSDASQQAYERFVDGQAALDQEVGERVEPPRPSRKSAWLAMGAVGVALGLLWLAPGAGTETTQQSAATQASSGAGGATIDPDAAADALAVGKPAPLQFTMQDMN